MCVLSVFVSTCVLLCESCFVSGGVSTDCAVSSWLVPSIFKSRMLKFIVWKVLAETLAHLGLPCTGRKDYD